MFTHRFSGYGAPMKHASWCAKAARPADPKQRGVAVSAGGEMRRVGEAACTCASSATARGLIKLRAMGVMR